MGSFYGMKRRAHLRRLALPALAIAVIALLSAFAVSFFLAEKGTPAERADRLSSMGEFEEADALYRQALQSKRVSLPTIVGFIDNEHLLLHTLQDPLVAASFARGEHQSVDLASILRRPDIDPTTAILARYW
ncbi:MAG: hypothetical protein WBX15_18745, partial [Thermoanaerobaculia bacterium]